MPSPSASRSHPYLPGGSRTPSPPGTPPFPGPGIAGIPDILSDEEVLPKGKGKATIPNPYSSDESEDEPTLDQVAFIRRSLTDRAKKGWMAHQSVFPPSSSSDTDSESDKETEQDTEDDPLDPLDELEEPLIEPGERKPPVRLQVYHGRFGHWEREGLRKYKGASNHGHANDRFSISRSMVDVAVGHPLWLALCLGTDRGELSLCRD